jgi:uncharacterized protein YcbX
MATQNEYVLGAVGSLWRYPVKSMMGEELNAAELTERGLEGDRAWALVDAGDGKVVTAKNPRKWPRLFEFRAALVDPSRAGDPAGPVRITLPDGTLVTSDQYGCDQILSQALGRNVTLDTARPVEEDASAATDRAATAEEYWPDMEGLAFRETVTDFELPAGTFFDCAVVHLLTTATLDRLSELYPQGRFEARRFRPNIVIQSPSGETGFLEESWVGRTLAIGEEVRLAVTGPCGRCVMTTLAQGDLPKDPGILRTAAQHNEVHVGVYAAVAQGGVVRRGDPVGWAA